MPLILFRRGLLVTKRTLSNCSSDCTMKSFARFVSAICGLWVLFFLLFGGTTRGKDLYGRLANQWMGDNKKAGIPVIALTIPILMAGSVASLFNIQTTTPVRRRNGVLHIQPLARIIHCGSRRLTTSRNMDWLAFWIIACPLILYVSAGIGRNLTGTNADTSYQIMKIGNCFGKMALLAMAIILVPITTHNPLLALWGIPPIDAVRLHVWCGRIIVIGSLLHGVFHMIRWTYYQKESFWNMFLPPTQCWLAGNSVYEPTCRFADSECTCYHHFRNFTGVLAVVGMLVMFLSSLHSIRRLSYAVFITIHRMAAPIVIVATAMHYDKAILYMASSLLFYLALMLPTWVEQHYQSTSCRLQPTTKAIQVVDVTQISCVQGRDCVSITIAATDRALHQFRPGMYVHVMVPTISKWVSHPFTINKVLKESSTDHEPMFQLRIIFREVGPFTKAWARQLSSSDLSRTPMVSIRGFSPGTDLLSHVAQHDVVVLIAAGIGITPYLSLLGDMLLNQTEQPQKLVLHWICRDISLVKYINHEYFEPYFNVRQTKNDGVCIMEVNIHDTSGLSENSIGYCPDDHDDDDDDKKNNNNNNNNNSQPREYLETNPGKVPATTKFAQAPQITGSGGDTSFTPSRFSVGSRTQITGNVCNFLGFSLIAWLGLVMIWYLYQYEITDDRKTVQGRAYAPFVVLLLGLILALFVNVLTPFAERLDPLSTTAGARREEGHVWNQVPQSEEEIEHQGDSNTQLVVPPSDMIEILVRETGKSKNKEREAPPLETRQDEALSMKMHKGRPAVSELLKVVDDAWSPGVFCCAPPELVNEIRKAAKSPWIGICATPRFTIYQESFRI